MTEQNTTDQPPQGGAGDPDPTPTPTAPRSTPSTSGPDLVDAPADADSDVASGYAVYDRTIGQYVGGVTSDKPTKGDAGKLVPKGHTAAVVRV